MSGSPSTSDGESPEASVVVPTFERPDDLLRCLGSLKEQRGVSYEVIVVDNAADPTLERRLRDRGFSGEKFRYLAEPQLGLHHARHAGARAARSPLLVFTDDDATFPPTWLHTYVSAFRTHPEMGAAGGPVSPGWETTPPAWLAEVVRRRSGSFAPLSLLAEGAEESIDPSNIFFGVNMAVRKDVLYRAGGFNPESLGSRWIGDGESGLNRKLADARIGIGYLPDAEVVHHIPAGRMSFEYLKTRMRNEGASAVFGELQLQGATIRRLIVKVARAVARQARIGAMAAALRRKHGATAPETIEMKMESWRSSGRTIHLVRLLAQPQLRAALDRETWLT